MGNRRQKHEQDTAIKLRFYFMSLWLLFVLIFLLTVDIPICFSKDAHFIGFGPLLKRNWLAFISLLFAILGWLVASREKQRWAGVTNPPYKIESIKNENYEYLTFLTTYIIPLICIDYNPADLHRFNQDSICVRAGRSIGANRVYLYQNGFILWESYLGTYGIQIVSRRD